MIYHNEDNVVLKPFKLQDLPRCYCCGIVLKAKEKQQKSTKVNF